VKAYRVFEDGKYGAGRFCEMRPEELDAGARVTGRRVVDFSLG